METFNVKNFISEMKKYSFLYDKDDVKFKNKLLKEQTWLLTAMQFNVSTDYVRKKWLTLASTYRRHKKEYLESLLTDEMKYPKWTWFSAMDDLLSNFHDFSDDVIFLSNSSISGSSASTSNTSEKITIAREISHSSTSTTQKRKKLKNDAQSTTSKLVAGIKQTKTKQNPDQDEAYFYCMSLSQRLRSLTSKDFALARLKIESVMFDLESNESSE